MNMLSRQHLGCQEVILRFFSTRKCPFHPSHSTCFFAQPCAESISLPPPFKRTGCPSPPQNGRTEGASLRFFFNVALTVHSRCLRIDLNVMVMSRMLLGLCAFLLSGLCLSGCKAKKAAAPDPHSADGLILRL